MSRFFRMAPVLAICVGVLTALTSTPAHAAGGGHSFNFWVNLFFPWFNLTILVFLVYRYGVPRIRRFMKERHERVKEGLTRFEERGGEIAARFRAVKDSLDNVEEECRLIFEETREDGIQEKQEIIERARKRARKMIEDVQRNRERQLKGALLSLKRNTIISAVSGAEEIIKTDITSADRERLARSFLEHLKEAP